jgi:hypothetical protein
MTGGTPKTAGTACRGLMGMAGVVIFCGGKQQQKMVKDR